MREITKSRLISGACCLLILCCLVSLLEARSMSRRIEAHKEYEAKLLTQVEYWQDQYASVRQEYVDYVVEAQAIYKTYYVASSMDKKESVPTWNTISNAKITAYCPCSICCGKWANGITATGVIAQEGRTVAVDPSVIPLGSEVEINGVIYIAENTGVRGNAIDLFMNSHQTALQWGVQRMDIRWREPVSNCQGNY